MSRERSG